MKHTGRDSATYTLDLVGSFFSFLLCSRGQDTESPETNAKWGSDKEGSNGQSGGTREILIIMNETKICQSIKGTPCRHETYFLVLLCGPQ